MELCKGLGGAKRDVALECAQVKNVWPINENIEHSNGIAQIIVLIDVGNEQQKI